MATPIEIYETYRLMPALQLHQLRVAAVTKLVCDSLDESLDTDSVVKAALLHDMGNIIKSDFSVFPEFCEPEGAAYWEGVKRDFVTKYGVDEHEATLQIAEQLGISAGVRALIDGVGFSKLEKTRDEGSLEQKIVEYGDLRVGPREILPMEARIGEAEKRYAGKHRDMPADAERFAQLASAAAGIEEQIFSHSRITPADITDATAAPVIEELKHFQVV